MAVVKRRNKVTAQNAIRVAQVALLRDQMPPPESNQFVQFDRQPKGQAAWEEYGEAITVEWIAQHPGTRPLFWWRYDCPVAVPENMNTAERAWCYAWAILPELVPSPEKQRAFLVRHGLLTAGE